MRIKCPFCGERDNGEFVFLGDATRQRPASPDAPFEDWMDYVYLRENPQGKFREYAQHAFGCRAWLIVTRDTSSHVIDKVEVAREAKLAEAKA